MKLFAEDLGTIKSNRELDILCAKYSAYDRAYICQSTVKDRLEEKEWMEGLWKQYEPYADKHFLSDFKKQYPQRAWELYLGASLLNRGFGLGKHHAAGPDFDVRDLATWKRLTWIEAIVVNKGNGNDRVPDMVIGGFSNVPEEEMMLRLTHALDKKFGKYNDDMKKGIVAADEPYVIAIDRSDLEHVDASAPLILKVLYGIGHLTITFALEGDTRRATGSFWANMPNVAKRGGTTIPTQFFLDPAHEGISAIIYTKDSILNQPRDPKDMGERFLIAHNLYAKNKIPPGLFPFGAEYIMEGNTAKCVRAARVV